MRWITIHCPECKWESPMVPEDVAEKFRSQLKYCQDCKARGVKVEFQYTERITNVNRSH